MYMYVHSATVIACQSAAVVACDDVRTLIRALLFMYIHMYMYMIVVDA